MSLSMYRCWAEVCGKWLKGRCQFGARCRYEHTGAAAFRPGARCVQVRLASAWHAWFCAKADVSMPAQPENGRGTDGTREYGKHPVKTPSQGKATEHCLNTVLASNLPDTLSRLQFSINLNPYDIIPRQKTKKRPATAENC